MDLLCSNSCRGPSICPTHGRKRGWGWGTRPATGIPKIAPGPETGERMLGEGQRILGSGSWLPYCPHPGQVMRMLVSDEGTAPENMSPPRCGSCPLAREPICPTVSEITPPAGRGVSIVTRTFGPQVVPTGPCNSSHNSLFRDREVGSQSGDCFPKHFCQWPRRTLCVWHPQEILKFRQLSNSKLNTPQRSLILWICVQERPECDCAGILDGTPPNRLSQDLKLDA